MRARITTLPCCPRAANGIGGAGITFAMAERSLGRGRRGGDEAGDRVRRRRQDQEPAHDLGQGMEPELEPGHHPEVAAAATDGPEQVRVPFVVDLEDRPVRGHDLGGQQAVDRQPVLAHQVADAAARRDPAEPDRAGVAEAGGEAALSRRVRVGARREPAAGPRRPRVLVDLEAIEVADVEHDPALDGAVGRPAVSAGAHGQLETAVSGERDDRPDVIGVRDPHDQRGTGVDAADRHGPCLVVVGVAGGDHASADTATDLFGIDGNGRAHVCSHAFKPTGQRPIADMFRRLRANLAHPVRRYA